MALFFASGLFFTLFLSLILQISDKPKIVYEKRIEKFLPKSFVVDKKSGKQTKEKKPKKNFFLMWAIRLLSNKKFVLKLEIKLSQAAVSLKPEEFFLLRLLVAAGFMCFSFLLGLHLLLLLTLAAIGYFSPLLFLKKQHQKRLARCSKQLPHTLGTMATSMKAGFSFMQAMQLIAKETPDPIGTEFSQTIRQINLGIPIEQAFEQLLERLPDEDLNLVVTAVLVQRSTGGNLAEILEAIQFTITERIRIKEELKTLTSQGRMSAWIITLLPVILGFILNMINPTYFSPMFNHPLGWAMLVFAGFSGLLGWVMIQKIVNIEV